MFEITALLVEALRNKAFAVNIPLLDTSLKDIFVFAKIFTDKLFQFFVRQFLCFFSSCLSVPVSDWL
jgi:hypothetical protein